MHVGLAVALGLSLLLAGCSGGSPSAAPSTSAAPAGVRDVDFEGSSGSVVGTVTNTEVVAIEGAQVALGEFGIVLTDANGQFAFQNVPPGQYTTFASALGFASAGKKVEVIAGEEARVAFQLEPLAVDEEVVEIQQNEGHICLQLGLSHPTGATPGIYINFGNLMCPDAGLIFIGFEVQPGIDAVVSEMTWQQTSGVTSRELRIENWQGGARSGEFSFDHRYGSAAGPSPVTLQYGLLEGETFDGVGDEPVTVDNAVIVPPDTSKPGGVNLVFDQRTTIYNSLFYGTLPSEGYSALPDG